MRKIWVVALHEYWFHVRRKGFLFSTFGMPLVLVGLLLLIAVLSISSNRVQAIGYLDQADVLHRLPPEFVWEGFGDPITMVRYSDLPQAQAGLRSAVVDAVFVVPPDYLAQGQVDAYALEVVPTLAEVEFERFLRAAVAQLIAQEPSERVWQPITEMHAVVLDAPTKTSQALVLQIAIPLIFGMALFGSMFAAGSYLMLAVAEEKEQRIMEILASSLSPVQMMAGKILGLGALGLTQLVVWTGGGVCIALWALARLGLFEVQTTLGRVLLLGFMLYIPAYLLIAATLSAIGAAVSSVQEGQQLTGVVTLFYTMPLWFFTVITDQPNGTLALMLNLIPFTAPITLLQRVTLIEVPLWQIVATVIWLWLAALAMIWFSGKVVRYGLLRYNRRLSWRDLRRLK